MSVTRKEVMTAVTILDGINFTTTVVVHDAIRHICEYVKQAPDPDADPDATVRAEIDELLEKLTERDPGNHFELVCSTGTPDRWQVTTRRTCTQKWAGIFQRGWVDLPEIRDQLKTLATQRGLLTPSLEEMQEIAKAIPDDDGYLLSKKKAAKVKAFITALAAEGDGRWTWTLSPEQSVEIESSIASHKKEGG